MIALYIIYIIYNVYILNYMLMCSNLVALSFITITFQFLQYHLITMFYSMYPIILSLFSVWCNSFLITVSPLGSVEATPDNQTVAYNGTATFNCTAEGGPNNIFRWIRDTPSFQSDIIDLSDFDDLEVISTEPELTLPLSTGGYYSCVVFNDAGYGYDTVTLYVSPIILTQPTDQFVQNSDGVTLTCEGDSFPEPKYQWEKMNIDLAMFESVPDKTSNTLVFDTIEHSDFGSYRCVVTTPIIDETITSDNVTITG